MGNADCRRNIFPIKIRSQCSIIKSTLGYLTQFGMPISENSQYIKELPDYRVCICKDLPFPLSDVKLTKPDYKVPLRHLN